MEVNPLHILFISSWYPNRVQPTLGNFVQKHAEAVSDFARVTVLHVCYDDTVKGSKHEVVEQSEGKIRTIFIYLKKNSNSFFRFYKYLKAYSAGMKMVKKEYGTPDIIHANVLLPVGIVFCFLRSFSNIPFVFTEHWAGYLPEYPFRISLVKKYFVKKIIKRSKAILPVTDNLKNAMIQRGFKGKYIVVPNVVDTDIFIPVQNNVDAVKHILHVSSPDNDQKNISGILNIIKKLSEKRQDFVLNMVIDGDFAMFKKQAEDLDILNKIVFFHGTKNTEEVADMMKNSNFLILFSNYENFPCVIAEAMACGLPVLSTDVGGIAEHVNKTYGILIKAKENDAFENELNQMLDIFSSFDKKQIRSYAETHFSYEVIGRQLVEIYNNILCS